jgi:hypothetical protein
MTVEERLAVLEHQVDSIKKLAIGVVSALVVLLAANHFVFIPTAAKDALKSEAGETALQTIKEAEREAAKFLSQKAPLDDIKSQLGELAKTCVKYGDEISLRRDEVGYIGFDASRVYFAGNKDEIRASNDAGRFAPKIVPGLK